jgi:hypothetical protein
MRWEIRIAGLRYGLKIKFSIVNILITVVYNTIGYVHYHLVREQAQRVKVLQK